jgi:hypothetical protein
MNMREAFEANQTEIARRVNECAERVHLPANELTGALATHMRVDDRGTLWLYQPMAKVMLTRSQQIALMDRIAVLVLQEQAKGLPS